MIIRNGVAVKEKEINDFLKEKGINLSKKGITFKLSHRYQNVIKDDKGKKRKVYGTLNKKPIAKGVENGMPVQYVYTDDASTLKPSPDGTLMYSRLSPARITFSRTTGGYSPKNNEEAYLLFKHEAYNKDFFYHDPIAVATSKSKRRQMRRDAESYISGINRLSHEKLRAIGNEFKIDPNLDIEVLVESLESLVENLNNAERFIQLVNEGSVDAKLAVSICMAKGRLINEHRGWFFVNDKGERNTNVIVTVPPTLNVEDYLADWILKPENEKIFNEIKRISDEKSDEEKQRELEDLRKYAKQLGVPGNVSGWGEEALRKGIEKKEEELKAN